MCLSIPGKLIEITDLNLINPERIAKKSNFISYAGFGNKLKQEEKLLLQIEALERGEEPTIEKKKIEMFEFLVVCLLIYIAIKLSDINNNNFPKF